MPGKYFLNINDSGTKEILGAFFTPESAAKISRHLVFKSVEFPEEGPGPMIISAFVDDLSVAPVFDEIVPRLMGSASGREIKYDLEFKKARIRPWRSNYSGRYSRGYLTANGSGWISPFLKPRESPLLSGH